MGDEVTVWKVIGTVAKGVARSVQLLGEGAAATVGAANQAKSQWRHLCPSQKSRRSSIPPIRQLNLSTAKTARDARDILGQSAISLKTEQTSGAWVPWYDPPRFGDFPRRHLEILVDEIPILYVWQRGDFIYWTNRLDSEGRPAKAYKMGGVTHVGGTRTLVVRHDPNSELQCVSHEYAGNPLNPFGDISRGRRITPASCCYEVIDLN
ncbi:hypothetical protein HC776_01870 [bacterium]|nr:hypothetical protein [bacterium]